MLSESQSFKQRIPWLMAATRVVLGPAMIMAQRSGWNGLTLAAMVIAALLSDIFDGVLARRWRCDTAGIRLFDSMADNIFYLGCGTSLWMRQPVLIRSLAVPIGIVLGIEVLKFVFDFAKFGKPSSYHSYLAKTWGLLLATTVVMSFATHLTLALRVAWWTTMGLGVLACLEGWAISVIMPEWRHDLKTLSWAIGVRRRILLERQRTAKRSLRGAAVVATLILLATVSIPSRASSIPSVTFAGGSGSTLSAGTTGSLDVSSPDKLVFHADKGSEITIPYSQIQDCTYQDPVAHRLGVLPALAVGLVGTRIHNHLVTLTYLDTAHARQTVIFQLPHSGPEVLLLILHEHTTACPAYSPGHKGLN
jgi:CDP-diacylglycerol--glycerol-3-phosphate 3-phosphatidyltransferase